MKSPGRRRATILGAGFAAVVLLSLVFLGPGSFRVWSSQQHQTKELNAKIATLQRANEALAKRAKQLKDPEAIKELARRDYGMAPKGSQAYAILPAARPDDRPGGAWPFVKLASKNGH